MIIIRDLGSKNINKSSKSSQNIKVFQAGKHPSSLQYLKAYNRVILVGLQAFFTGRVVALFL